MNEPIENLVEAALFFRGGSMTIRELSTLLGVSEEKADEGVTSLAMSLKGRGLSMVRDGANVA